MNDQDVVRRHGARVLVVDGAARVLLIRGSDPATPGASHYWFTPGGGIEPGEDGRRAAMRELAEETGLVVGLDQLTGPVHDEDVRFSFNGRAFAQHNDFYLVRTTEFEATAAGWSELERRSMHEFRWWSAEAIETTDERVYPLELVGLLRELTGRPGGDGT